MEMTKFGNSIGYGPDGNDGCENTAYVPDIGGSKYEMSDPDNVHVNPAEDKGEDEDEDEGNCCARGILVVQQGISSCATSYNKQIWIVIKVVLFLLYWAYFGYALYYHYGGEGSKRLLGASVFGVILIIWHFIGDRVLKVVRKVADSCTGDCTETGRRRSRIGVRILLYVAMSLFIIIYTVMAIALKTPNNLMSLSGIALFIILLFVFSTNPAKVNWHPVFWGMAIQYVFACLILKTWWGYETFKWLGDRVSELLSYSNSGAIFVFGEKYTDHVFAFKVLPVIIYFSTMISVLYYLGIMQAVIKTIGKFLAFALDTTPAESLSAAGNIFAGQTESPLLIRPFMPYMTKSELHAIMTGGFATVSGSVLGAYTSYGVPANHLLSASVMSAPAALAMSKLFCPATEKTEVDEQAVYKMQKGSHRNVIEAASDGASTAIKLVANVAVNVMAFLAILAFVNGTLTWFGDRVGIEGLSFELICSYVFYPIAYTMGVDPVDCRRVAKLIGFKTFTNEFVAYIEMGKLLDNGKVFNNYTLGLNNTNWHLSDMDVVLDDWNVTLAGGYLLPRSEVISTYALCGFSNLGSMGIQLGGLGAMAPSRKSDMSDLVLRAMIAGNVACFMTACISGLFYEEF
ncbi:solute carrier family 28 member 3-like [Gigantopelta aegis]|uniref:solute carrier family 28 member 3-like n=1 Tax=Gigantopelta aegis TaxID=1735272 RepID=UPI001B8886D5|nr:solute carrier family 28 member 3-like [Gigantopelta aegis]XP_041367547.1 solute carrier family 28 member 3-like [Gigantopelta aegis]